MIGFKDFKIFGTKEKGFEEGENLIKTTLDKSLRGELEDNELLTVIYNNDETKETGIYIDSVDKYDARRLVNTITGLIKSVVDANEMSEDEKVQLGYIIGHSITNSLLGD